MVKREEEGLEGQEERVGLTLDELARLGAPRLLKAAVAAEVSAYVAAHQAERDAPGRALVVRHGHGRGRRVVMGSGTLTVPAPRVDERGMDAAGERRRVRRRMLPPSRRRAPKVAEVRPMLYVRGRSTGDVREALPVRLGEAAAGLSPPPITRLTAAWETESTAFRQRDLRGRDEVSIWVDGVHCTLRLEDERRCTLVVMGARADGTTEVMAVEDGDRESTESWLTALRDLKRRGLTAPVVAVGDGARGCWNAVGAVWPEVRAPRGWVHRLANVLDTWPKRLPPKATRAWHEIMHAATRGDAAAGITAFTAESQATDPKAVASLTRDQEQRLTCFEVPAEPCIHWRTTNPVASPFSTVRLRQRVTKGAGSRTKGLVMAYKLFVMAEARWRQLNAPHLLPLVQAKVKCADGIQPRKHEEQGVKDAA
jgi:transposase-like protein